MGKALNSDFLDSLEWPTSKYPTKFKANAPPTHPFLAGSHKCPRPPQPHPRAEEAGMEANGHLNRFQLK